MPAIRRAFTLTGVLLALLAGAGTVLTQSSPRTVLVVYDGGREFSSIQLTDRGIESTLTAALGPRVTIFREYLDLTRIHAPGYEDLLRAFFRAKYAADPPDAIVAVRGRALDFLLEDAALFPGVPIVSAGMDVRQVQARRLPPHVTGVTLSVTYLPTVAVAHALQPDLQQIVVLTGTSASDRALDALVRDEFGRSDAAMSVSYLSGLSLDEALQRVGQLPARSALLFVSFAQDRDGQALLPTEAVRLFAQAASVPTYVNSEDVMDAGAVGGNLISFVALGRDAAGLVLRVLDGQRPSDLPFVELSTRVPTVDARVLERWTIAMPRVPAGSVILNRVPTMWEIYQWRILAAIVIVATQSALIALLLVQRRRRRMVEASLLVSEEQRHAAVLNERNRMARDMHDTLAQGFAGVIVQLQAAEHALEHGASAEMESHVHRASELARQSLGEARRSIRALRPQALEAGSLCDALEQMQLQVTAGTGLRATFVVKGEPRSLPHGTEENLLRMHQEMLTNSLKHSRGTRLDTVLTFEPNAVRLDVRDDGAGFDPALKHDGLGLLGIRERVHQMSGRLSLETRIAGGTHISITVPDDPTPSTLDHTRHR